MKLFHRRPKWQRTLAHAAQDSTLRRTAIAAAGVVGASVLSAAVTAVREKGKT